MYLVGTKSQHLLPLISLQLFNDDFDWMMVNNLIDENSKQWSFEKIRQLIAPH